MKNLLENIKSSYYFLQGNYRYALYYSAYSWLIRKHIFGQIETRIHTIQGGKCWLEGSCVHCGCQVPKLTMSNKVCGNKCYPSMVSKSVWEKLTNGKTLINSLTSDMWKIKEDKFIKISHD